MLYMTDACKLPWAPCPRDAVCFSQCSKNQLCMHLCVWQANTLLHTTTSSICCYATTSQPRVCCGLKSVQKSGYTDGTESFTAFIRCEQRKRQRRVLPRVCAETRARESSRIHVRMIESESFQQQISSVIRLIQSKWSAFVSARYSI